MLRTRKILLASFVLPVALCLLMVAVYELELLLPGDLAGNATAEVLAVGTTELLTICLIPVALRMFKWTPVRRRLQQQPAQALRRWGLLRLAMLALPMVANTWLYYQTMNVAPGYLAIIGLLALVFVFPSEARCQSEINSSLP